MPARTLPGTIPPDIDQIARTFTVAAGLFDDPIAKVRISFNSPKDLGGGTYERNIKFEVCDRLDAVYGPTGFRRPLDPALDARWWIVWFVSDSKFGTPVDYGAEYQTGANIAIIGNTRIAQTDSAGVVEVKVSKGTGEIWVHACMLCLPRAKGLNWTTGAVVSDPPGTGGDGSGEVAYRSAPEVAYVQQPAAYTIVMPSAAPSVGQKLQVSTYTSSIATLVWVP